MGSCTPPHSNLSLPVEISKKAYFFANLGIILLVPYLFINYKFAYPSVKFFMISLPLSLLSPIIFFVFLSNDYFL